MTDTHPISAGTHETSYTLPGIEDSYMTSVRDLHYSQQQPKTPPQSGVFLIPTPQQITHPTWLYPQTSAAAQIQQEKQVVQPQPTLSDTMNTTAPLRPYVHEQHAWPPFQSAQLSSAQRVYSTHTLHSLYTLAQGQPVLPQLNANAQSPRLHQLQIQLSQYQPGRQQQHAQLTSEGHQVPHVPHALPQTTRPRFLKSQRILSPTMTPNSIRSSEFAHLRGNDWVNAAQESAREIAANITAQERDDMAQSIINRQRSITNQPPSLVSATSMNAPTDYMSQLLPRSHSATDLPDDRPYRVHANTPFYANAPTCAHAPANLPTGTRSRNDYKATRGTVSSTSISDWSMAMPDSGMRLPTLAEVRSRYRPSQLQSVTVNTADPTSTPVAQMCGSILSQKSPLRTARAQGSVQVSQDLLLRQPLGVQQNWPDGRADALQQLRNAADPTN